VNFKNNYFNLQYENCGLILFENSFGKNPLLKTSYMTSKVKLFIEDY